jgi:UMF1 family MFS transporter
MASISKKQRIWGWMFFDWAQQPYATLGLTFVFSPYFAAVAAGYFLASGLSEQASSAQAQSLWSSAQTVAGLTIALTAPLLGAYADASGRKMPIFYVLAAITALCAFGLWGLEPDGTGLMLTLVIFWVGFVASESAFSLNNSFLPSLSGTDDAGKIGGSAIAFGYWGGVLALFIVLLLFAENEQGVTLIGNPPPFGLDPEAREGTRFTGPFIAIWWLVFLVPFFLWTRDDPAAARKRPPMGQVLRDLGQTIKGVSKRKSYRSFLLSSMFYRDALTALYSYGGIYAKLVLGWEIVQIGVFGIVAAIAAAVLSYVGGRADHRFGPKPVISFCCWVLILVSAIIVGMSRESLFGIALAEGSALPDIIFYTCGVIMGGAGGVLYSASRTMMVRHIEGDRAAEAFGLFSLTGRATAFLAPALITVFTTMTQSNQLGFLPVIFLFLLGLLLLSWVKPEGDRADDQNPTQH